MKTVLCIIIALLALILYTKIISVLSMLEKKKEHIISETKLNNIDVQQESITLTNAYLALIIEVCRIEVSRHMASLKAINLKYDFLKLDEDVSSISEKVHHSLQKDFMIKYLKNENIVISELMTKPSFVTESMNVDDVIRLMQKEKKHLLIVVDEYGGTSGIVSMEDALEEVVGEIYDEHDDEPVKKPITKIGENKYLLNPEMSVEDLYDYLEIEHLPEESYSSVGIMLYELSQKLPSLGEKFTVTAIDDVLNEHNDYVHIVTKLNFTITKMEERRIEELMLEVSRDTTDDDGKDVKIEQ